MTLTVPASRQGPAPGRGAAACPGLTSWHEPLRAAVYQGQDAAPALALLLAGRGGRGAAEDPQGPVRGGEERCCPRDRRVALQQQDAAGRNASHRAAAPWWLSWLGKIPVVCGRPSALGRAWHGHFTSALFLSLNTRGYKNGFVLWTNTTCPNVFGSLRSLWFESCGNSAPSPGTELHGEGSRGHSWISSV